MAKKSIFIIIALILLLPPSAIYAQDNPDNPIYIVQPGENLYEIAAKFSVDVQELITTNGIINANLISEGTELRIPGLDGVSGVLITSPVQVGETLQVLLRKSNISLESFQRLNKITSPAELFVGSNLILPDDGKDLQASNNLFVINPNTTIFDESILSGTNRWSINRYDDVISPINLPGESYFYFSDKTNSLISTISASIESIELRPLPIVQGHTAVISVKTKGSAAFSGYMNGHTLHFFPDETGQSYYALHGLHALDEPGLVPLQIDGHFENGDDFHLDQMVLLTSGGFVNETLTVESTLIDEALNIEEANKIQGILFPVSDKKLWNDAFHFPIDGTLSDGSIAISSYFGNRSSYNNGEYFGFHGGLDFWVVLNSLNIYAPAPGTIIFAGPMDIRGYTTFIDHGQGVVSGYGHQSEILVEEGQHVETGDLIGLIGKTGRVTGPHLHWDIWVNGNQIDPFDWIENQYP